MRQECCILYRLVVNVDIILASDNLTNGVTAMLLNISDGELGIRVMWSIKSKHLDCQFTAEVNKLSAQL